MPIIKPAKHTAPVFYPESNYRLVKYLDITKFISLLQRKSLFFCRLDKLEDHFEGTTSKANFNYRVQWYKHMHDINFFKDEYDEEKVKKNVQEQYDFEKKLKALNCVCCWNKNESESAALWKIYSDFHKGIMITTSVERIEKAFKTTQGEIHLSEIRYIDLNKDRMPDGNTMYLMIHKHKAYSFEEEVRLIYEESPHNAWTYDWSKEEVEEGKYLSVNLEVLIDKIIISPYSPNWYLNLIQNITDKYELNREIKKSELAKQ